MTTWRRFVSGGAGAAGDTAMYFSTVVASQIASLILLPITTRYLAPDVYGEYALVLSVTGLVGIIGSVWVRTVAMRLYFDHVAAGRTRAFFTTAASLQAVTMSLTLVVSYLAVRVWGLQVSGRLYLAAGASVLVGDFYALAANTLRAGQRSTRFGAAEWVGSALRVGATWGALAAGYRSSFMLFACATLALGAASLVAIRSLRDLLTGPAAFEREMARELFALGGPYIPQSISSWVMSLSDRVLIARFMDVAAVGVYSAAYSVADRAVSGLMSALLMAAWPAILAAWSTDTARVPSVISRWLGAYVLLTLGPAVLLVAQREFVLRVLLSPQYAAAADVVPWVVAGAWLSGVATYLNRPLELQKQYVAMSVMALVSAVLNIVFNLLLIPAWGVTGAAAATTAAFLAWAILSRVIAARVLHVPIPWAAVGGAVLATVLALASAQLFSSPFAAIPVFAGVYLLVAGMVWMRVAAAPGEPAPAA